MDISDRIFKIGILGDPEVGKSSITLMFVKKAFREQYEPTVKLASITRNIISRTSGQVLKFEIIQCSPQAV